MANDKNTLELNCAGYRVTAEATNHGPGGATYQCRCAPVSAADRLRLRRAVVAKTPVKLVFADRNILLGDIQADEGSDDWVGIAGRVLDA
jgi:hypothetical protein